MKQEIPGTRSINYIALLIQSLFLGLLYFVFIQLHSDEPLIWASMVYLILAYGLRYFVPVDHRKGLRELRSGHYEAALNSFNRSYNFFTLHPWIDKYRALTIFSASKLSYREMALLYKAHAQEQIGE